MKPTAFMMAVLISGCAATGTQAQTGVCNQKASTTLCIDQPLVGADKIAGKAAAGANVNITVDGKLAGSTKAKSDGTFSVAVPSLVKGQSVEAVQTTVPTGTAGPVAVKEQLPAEKTMDDIRVEIAANDGTSIDIISSLEAMPEHLLVRDGGLQARVKGLQKGDHVSVVVEDKDSQHILQSLAIKMVTVMSGKRTWVLIGSALAFFLLCLLLSWGHPFRLIIGEDGRYSNSKFQMALWFGIAIVTYVATVWLRVQEFGADFLGLVNIPQNLLLLSGMSALTFGAAKGITSQKVQNAKDSGNPDPKRTVQNASFLSDLTSNDSNQLDIGDFQMLVVTLLAVVTYCALVFHFLGALEMRAAVTLPDVDTTILAAFGLGQAAYLTKKAVGPVAKT